LRALVHSLAPAEECEAIIERYRTAAVIEEDVVDMTLDPELADLLEEMALSDSANAADLKAYRDELKKQTVAKLEKQRRVARAQAKAKATAKAKVRAKAKAAAKAKAGNKKKIRRGMVKIGGAGAAVGGDTGTGAPAPAGGPGAPAPAGGAGAAPAPAGSPGAAPPPAPGAAVPPVEAVAPPGGPPPPPPLVVPPPVPGGYIRIERPGGGWFYYSETLMRLDAHCHVHTKCAMNRTLRKGPIGLLMAWLESAETCASKEDHDQAKEDLSHGDSREARVRGRDAFGLHDRSGLPGFDAVARHEKELRGGDTSEPMQIDCAPGPLTKQMRQALMHG